MASFWNKSTRHLFSAVFDITTASEFLRPNPQKTVEGVEWMPALLPWIPGWFGGSSCQLAQAHCQPELTRIEKMMNGKRVQWHFCELILGFSTSPESALKPPGSKTEKMLLHRITSILYFFFFPLSLCIYKYHIVLSLASNSLNYRRCWPNYFAHKLSGATLF